MILAVVGSRDIKSEKIIFDKLDQILSQNKIVKVVSGDAKGVDSISKKWAKIRGIEYKGHLPDWKTPTPGVPMKMNKFGEMFNPVAGKERNTLIVNDCTHLIAFWDGKSGGTLDSINKAKKQNKVLEIVIVKI